MISLKGDTNDVLCAEVRRTVRPDMFASNVKDLYAYSVPDKSASIV